MFAYLIVYYLLQQCKAGSYPFDCVDFSAYHIVGSQ